MGVHLPTSTTAIKTTQEISPEQLLANAIIATAAVDYINACINNDIFKIRSNERFFHSDAYAIYTTVSPDYLIRLCKLKAEECKAAGKTRYAINRKGLLNNGE